MNSLDQLLAKGDLPRAKAEAERLLAANPQDAAALVAMAKIHLVDGQLDAAEPFIARAEARGPSPQVHLLRGNVFGQKGQLAEAEEQYRKALQLDPKLAEAHFGLGMMIAKRGRISDAIASLQRAADASPDNPVFHFRLGQALCDVGRNDEGTPHLEVAIAKDPKFVPAYLALAQLHATRGRLVESRKVLDRGLKVVPKQPRLVAALTNVTILQGDLKTARRLATKLAKQHPEDPDAQGNLAHVYLLEGRRQDAFRICQRMTSLGRVNAQLKMAEATYWEGENPPQFDKAIAAYEEAIAVDTEGWRAGNNLGQLLLRMKTDPPDLHVQRALSVLEEAHRRKPDQAEPRLNLALAYVRAGEKAKGLELARQLTAAGLPPGHTLLDQAERLVRVLSE